MQGRCKEGARKCLPICGWAEWCPQDIDYCDHERRSFVPEENIKLLLQPNPAHGITYAVFKAAEGLQLRLQVLDKVSGKVFKKLFTVQLLWYALHSYSG